MLARVWARLELGDAAGAMADVHVAVAAGRPADAAIARLRIDAASGAVDALWSFAHADPAAPPPRLSLTEDDHVLVPAEGLVGRNVTLPESLVRRLRALTRHDVPRLVRARARLSLALASAREADRLQIADEVARVARATHARALAAGQALVSAWPAPSDVEKAPMLDNLVAVLRVCQAHDDPRAALPGVCQLLRDRLRCSAVLVAGATPHGAIALARLGHDDLSAAARRAADLGQTVVTSESGATDCAVAVRLGDAVVGAMACHWVMPESRLDPTHRALLEAAAIAVAPTVRLAVELAGRPVVRPETSSLLGVSQPMATCVPPSRPLRACRSRCWSKKGSTQKRTLIWGFRSTCRERENGAVAGAEGEAPRQMRSANRAVLRTCQRATSPADALRRPHHAVTD